jgi:tRNA/tmRNA/rRNA uracil-C5-methylase (TrmA/RlmC/RlmD family)
MIYTITDLSRAGSGVARDSTSGRVVFVPFTAPGDVVRAEITREEKNYAHARLLEVLTPSALRVEPPCEVFGRCGGCQWQHLPYAHQWQTKVSGIRQALKRAQVEVPADLDEHPAEQPWHYRNRIQLRGEGGQIGFHAAESQRVVPIETCPIAREELNARIPSAREQGARLSQPYKVEIEVLPSGETRESWNAGHAALGFRQVNDEQNARLQAWVAARVLPGRVLYDLFGGAANLSAPLAAQASHVHCVDLTVPQVRPAGLSPQLEFHRGDVLGWLEKQARRKRPAGPGAQAIIDPPRVGLGPALSRMASALDQLGVQTVIAVGCDVDAWAKDLSRWVKAGWRVRRLAAFDFFPQTIHVESVALLEMVAK